MSETTLGTRPARGARKGIQHTVEIKTAAQSSVCRLKATSGEEMVHLVDETIRRLAAIKVVLGAPVGP